MRSSASFGSVSPKYFALASLVFRPSRSSIRGSARVRLSRPISSCACAVARNRGIARTRLITQRPFLGRAVGLLAGLRHALQLPVDRAERFADIGVERALLIPPHLMLAQQEADLRERDVAIDAQVRRQRGGIDGLDRLAVSVSQ